MGSVMAERGLETAPIRPREENRPGPTQYRLGGLMAMVVGAAITFAVARRAGTVWPKSTGDFWRDFDRCSHLAVGILLMPSAVCMVMALLGQIAGGFRRRAGGPEVAPRRLVSIAWRLIALVALGVFLFQQARVLRLADYDQWAQINWNTSDREERFQARLHLTPLVGAMMMTGLVLGLRPSVRHQQRQGRLSDTFRAVAVGMAAVTLASLLMMIPYLVLLAMEGVTCALNRRPFAPRLGPARRFDLATVPTLLSVGACLLTAAWLNRDLRGAQPRESPRSSAIAFALRAASLIATAACGWWLAFRTFPMLIQEAYAPGLGFVIGTNEVVLVVFGFATLASGLAARAVGSVPNGESDRAPRSWTRQFLGALGRTALGLVLTAVILASLGTIASRYTGVRDVLHPAVAELFSTIWQWVEMLWKKSLWIETFSGEPDLWFPLIVVVWLWIQTVSLLGSQDGERPAPFDDLFCSPKTTLRFAWYTLALTVLTLAALPILTVSGLLLFHYGFAGGAVA